MRFDLKVRPTEAADPSGDDLEMYLDALREEISGVGAVVRVRRIGLLFHIDTEGAMLLGELKDRLKPAFSSTLALHIRFVSLEQAAA